MQNKKTYMVLALVAVLAVIGVIAVSSYQGSGQNYQGFLSGKSVGIDKPLTREPTPGAAHPEVTISQAADVVTSALPGTTRTRLLGFKINVSKGPFGITFKKSSNNIAIVALDGSFSGNGIGSCFLTDGMNDYAVTTNGFNNAGNQYFDFGLKNLTVNGGSSKTLYVECDTTSAVTKGDTVTARLPFLSWSDVASNNIYRNVNLTGPTFVHP